MIIGGAIPKASEYWIKIWGFLGGVNQELAVEQSFGYPDLGDGKKRVLKRERT